MREMKDSGIEWIGEIPKEWICCKQKYVMQLINGRAFSDSEFEDDGKYPILRVGNLFSNPVWYTSSLELGADKYCEYGDLLYSWSMSYAPIIWTGEKVIYHYHIWKVKLNNSIDKKFAFYYLTSLTDALKAEIHETTMGFITMGVMNNSYIAFPDLYDQRRIADFLDNRCTEIDALTSDITFQIDMLEQYKRSVITEAVTKGLNPDTEMKDTGVEWVGEIPEKWQMLKLKYITSHNDEALSENTDKDFVFDYIDIGAIKDNKIVSLQRMNFAEAPSRARRVVQRDDIIVSTVRTYLKAIAIINDFDVQQIASTGFIVLRANSNVLMPQFLKYSVLSESFIDMVEANSVGITYPAINESKVVEIKIPVPLLQEQKEIADYLDDKCFSIDAVIADKQAQLDTLAEYKKSLIYEYVTGKKDTSIG